MSPPSENRRENAARIIELYEISAQYIKREVSRAFEESCPRLVRGMKKICIVRKNKNKVVLHGETMEMRREAWLSTLRETLASWTDSGSFP